MENSSRVNIVIKSGEQRIKAIYNSLKDVVRASHNLLLKNFSNSHVEKKTTALRYTIGKQHLFSLFHRC